MPGLSELFKHRLFATVIYFISILQVAAYPGMIFFVAVMAAAYAVKMKNKLAF
jgi:hypothetical protein